jgi:hypothetical protein
MAIASAVQNGMWIIVYDERGRQVSSIPTGTNGTLQGYTSTTVSVRSGRWITIYNEKGNVVSSVPA